MPWNWPSFGSMVICGAEMDADKTYIANWSHFYCHDSINYAIQIQ